jgi:mercuric ion transport protein
MEQISDGDARRQNLVAFGGLIGAVLASACCVAPLVLLTLGVSGAWIGNLTALAPYQGYFTFMTLMLLAFGYWFVYWKPKQACEEGSYCANPRSDRIIKSVLWVSTLLIGVALTVDGWASLFA